MSKPGRFTDFNSLLDKATNPMQLEPDSESVKKICLLIDKDVVEAPYAIQAICVKMTDDNPHTVLFALRVLEKIFYECGNLAHRVICTENFMSLLKDIIETTEQKLIRDKILELVQTWTNTFKHLPQYCAPENLLRNLQAEGYVFPGFEAKTLPCDKRVSNHSKSQSITNGVPKKNDSGIVFDADMKNREDYYIKSLREIQEQKKRDYKQYRKSIGMTTSSDEEDNGNVSNKEESLYEENCPKSYGLPAELRKVKQSRQAVDRELQEYRQLKNEEFQQKNTDENGGSNKVLQLRNPADKCLTCEKYKKKCSHDIVFERSTPRLHPDLRKVKESREIIKNSFEEVKNTKRQEYYASKSNDRIDVDNNSNWRCRNEDSPRDSLEIDNEEFRNAIDISQVDANSTSLRKPRTRIAIEREEQEALEKAIQLSLLEPGPHSSLEDDELQRAIDMSFAEAEEQNFSAAPKLENNEDDNVLLSYVTELSLDDSYEKESKLAELYAKYDVAEPCVICKNETMFLKSFKPCNHRCICDDCSKMYNSQVCPICRDYYSSIRF